MLLHACPLNQRSNDVKFRVVYGSGPIFVQHVERARFLAFDHTKQRSALELFTRNSAIVIINLLNIRRQAIVGSVC